MARAARSSTLESRSSRTKLPPRKSPYRVRLGKGQALGYYKPPKGVGSWVAFLNPSKTKDEVMAWRQCALGAADDFSDPGGSVLSYSQACEAARQWFVKAEQEALLAAGGEVPRKGPYTVGDAMADYLEDAKIRGMKGLAVTAANVRAHILPAFGGIQVARLTRKRIQDWHVALSESPRRRTGKLRGEPLFLEAPATDDAKRARKDTANRILTILKAALNLALRAGKTSESAPWREVKPFRGVTSARIRFLFPEDQRRLVNACPEDFRRLVQAALYTGCRYGELTRLRVQDFDPTGGTLFISESKSGKPRHIWLTQEGQSWFEAQVAGKPSGALMLTRKGVHRTKRKADGESWAPCDQKYQMALACRAAGIDPLGFHELRHTYASMLVNAGVPLAYVAAQLGHADTRMVERYYGHLCPNALAESIRKLAPKLSLGTPPNVAGLKIAGAET